jgi:hypothetical protein
MTLLYSTNVFDPVSDQGILSSGGQMLLYPNRKYRQDYKHVKLLIPATKTNDRFCRTLFSALVNGFPAPNLINYNLTVKDFNAGQSAKISGYNDFFRTQTKERDVVIAVDGYDVTFQLSLDILMKRFEKQTYQTIFAADKQCYPMVQKSHFCDRIPNSTLPANLYGTLDTFPNLNPRFLNSGTTVGFGGTLRDILKYATELEKIGTVGKDDQAIIAETFSTGKFNFTLDYESKFFQTLIVSWDDVDWITNPDASTAPFWHIPLDKDTRKLDLSELALDTPNGRKSSPWADRRLLRNHRSNTIPVLFHHNLHKELIDIWYTYAWFSRTGMGALLQSTLNTTKGPEAGAGAWDGDKWIEYSDMCGSYDLFKESTSSQ